MTRRCLPRRLESAIMAEPKRAFHPSAQGGHHGNGNLSRLIRPCHPGSSRYHQARGKDQRQTDRGCAHQQRTLATILVNHIVKILSRPFSEKFVFAVPNYRHKMLRFLVNLPSAPIFSQQGIDSAIC